MRILEGRRRAVEERREGLRSALGRAGEQIDRYTRELHQLGLDTTEREVRWLNELIESERAEQRGSPATSAGQPNMTAHDRHEHEKEPAMSQVRVAVVGVGNCAASLVQGVHYYADADPAARVPGLMHVDFGGYHVRDITFVAAFDVDAKKVGRDLSEAIGASENNTIKIADVPPLDVPVQRGHTLDGLGRFYRETITESDEEPVDVAQVLRDTAGRRARLLPAGGQRGGRPVLRAVPRSTPSVAFVNALPVFIASDPVWAEKFRAAGVPIVGDDIKSQVGATITHRVLAKLFEDRGVQLDRTMQLNVGGNMDFLNMKELERLESKKVSKTQSVTSQVDRDMGKDNVHIGPSDYVAWLDDRKWAYVRLEGRAFGDVPLNLEYKLEVWDSPELGRHHHRRGARGEDRQGPGYRRPDPVGVELLHEVPARAVRRRRGPRRRRGVHPRRPGALTAPPLIPRPRS